MSGAGAGNTGRGRRAGPGGRAKSGKPRPGSGGQGKRKLEGRGPTPPAERRPGHPAQRRAAAAGTADKFTGRADADRAGGRPGTADWASGRFGTADRFSGRSAAPDTSGGGTGTAGRSGGRPGASDRSGGRTGASDRSGGRTGAADRSGGRAAAKAAGSFGRSSGNASGNRPATGSGGRPAARSGIDRSAGRSGGGAGIRLGGKPDSSEVVTGRNAVLECLRAAVPATALLVAARLDPDDRITESIKLAADTGLAVVEAGRAELDRLTLGAVHQGIALRIRPYVYPHPDELLAAAASTGEQALIVALDTVTDPRNLGAVVRSVAAFGGHGVVIGSRRSAGVTAGAWKASAGALARVPVAMAPNLARALAGYAEAGLFVVGLDAAADADVGSLQLADGPLVLVIGSEGRGLSRLVGEHCDLLVKIPIGGTDSLNAGVAAGIALYQVAQLRRGAG